MAGTIRRFTIEYIEAEDRVRLTGEVAENATPVVIWITQRLACRLIPVLLQWLEKQTASPLQSIASQSATDAMHSFAQQAARSELKPQPPVRSESGGPMWLAGSVEAVMSDKRASLTFRGDSDQSANLALLPIELRQWLFILYKAWTKAQWPMALWPKWIESEKAPDQQHVTLH